MDALRRRLNRDQWAGLEALQAEPGENWWKDLLSLWVPSGLPSGQDGLRLAVRDGKLNFYRRGQSVALVDFDAARGGVSPPRMEIHARYVDGPHAEAEYLKFGAGYAPYPGRDQLRQWIRNTAYKHGPEKWGLDDVVGRNPGVIDLEMGIPGTAECVDLVVLEQEDSGGARLTLWEAKPLNSSRLRAREGDPPVLAQIARYERFRKCAAADIRAAYGSACAILIKLAAWAGKSNLLSPLLVRAQTHLSLSDEVGLALFRGVRLDSSSRRELVPYAGNWDTHRAKLAGVKLREAEDPADLVLAPA